MSIVLLLLSTIAPEADLEEAKGCSRIYLFIRLFPKVSRIIGAELVLTLKHLDGMAIYRS